MEYTSALRERIARPSLGDRTPLERLTGETPNISEFTDFDFYQFIIWYDPNNSNEGGQARHKLGRWLSPTKGCGQGLCYYILKENGTWTARSMVHPVTIKDYAKYPELKDKMRQFNEHVKEGSLMDPWCCNQRPMSPKRLSSFWLLMEATHRRQLQRRRGQRKGL